MLNLRLLLLALALLSPWASAQVIRINGQVWDGNGGPFQSGRVYHIISNGAGCCLQVPAGRTLTMQAGAIVKIESSISVHGTLVARGTTFTSYHDDARGGDTNRNGGATLPQRGDWSYIELGGSALFEDCKFFYGGRAAGRRVIWHRNGSMMMRRCLIEHADADGLDVSQLDAEVSDTTIRRVTGLPIVNVALRYITGLVNNKASFCDAGDYLRITHGILSGTGPLLLDHRHSLNNSGLFVLYSTTAAINVHAGASLSLPKGTILKFERGRLVTSRNLQILGTPAEPVVLTSLRDDAYGGDTTKDGNATQPRPGDWQGMQFLAGSDGSAMAHAIVRFGGFAGTEGAGIAIHGSRATVRDTVVESCRGGGLYLRGSFGMGYPVVTGCSFRNNTTQAGVNLPWQVLATAERNVASGNQGGDYFSCAPERPTTPLVVGPENYPGDVLVVRAGTLLVNGGELTLLSGTQIKFSDSLNSGFTVSLRGALRLLGTAAAPVVLTSFADDAVGGDTNGDGNATQPAPGQWRGVRIADDRVVRDSVLENVRIRYAGRTGQSAVEARNPRLTIRSVRVEHVLGRGFDLAEVRGDVYNPVVWDAARTGIALTGGRHRILHATVYGGKGPGIEETNRAFSGSVRNSIVWNNAGGNFGGTLTAAEVHSSNGGFAGTNGNLNVNPSFVNAAAGDFRLAANSACLGSGELAAALATQKDHDENSRVLDHALTGSARPDMGAFERAAYRLRTVGNATRGTTMAFTVEGPAGVCQLIVGLLDGSVFLPPLGVETAGLTILFLTPGPIPVGRTLQVPIPNDPTLVGIRFGVQGLGVPTANPRFGNLTNLHRDRVR